MFDLEVMNVTMRFRMDAGRTSSLKEYLVKRARRELRYTEFTALSDVSFALRRGESLGVVGRNGAGKSTLLKCVARVYKPTSGTVVARGSVAPLIELGAGFDHELSGRDNIFLSGALLGYSKRAMAEKYAAIVEFSGLNNFMDTALKNYSSGMKARLGFAVAALAEPDILIVDEILAVGDEQFQLKSSARIEAMLGRGATLLFASHSAGEIQRLCTRAIWLKDGEIAADGEPGRVLSEYGRWARGAEGAQHLGIRN